MDIAETYAKFQHEQQDATDPWRRTRFDAFGEPIDTPTVEGFDQWGRNGHDRKKYVRRVQDQEHAHALALIEQERDEARRRTNRLLQMRKLVK